MAKGPRERIRNASKNGSSPVGSTVEDAARRRLAQNPRYRAERQRLAEFESVARSVVMRRAELGLSQQEVARRMGTSHSVISRIESGQHATTVKTLKRLADALESSLVVEFESAETPSRERSRV